MTTRLVLGSRDQEFKTVCVEISVIVCVKTVYVEMSVIVCVKTMCVETMCVKRQCERKVSGNKGVHIFVSPGTLNT